MLAVDFRCFGIAYAFGQIDARRPVRSFSAPSVPAYSEISLKESDHVGKWTGMNTVLLMETEM